MATLLHLAFRVTNPVRAAALYAELLDGRVVDIGGPLDAIGVKGVVFGRNAEDVLRDQIELWPADKRWTSKGFVDVEICDSMFGHFAVRSGKPHEEIMAIAEKHGVKLSMEERGTGYLVPVIYDHDGNFLEIFRTK
jgi:hypothetical protein